MTKKIVKEGVAGTDNKMDLIVRIYPGEGIDIDVEGKDVAIFGDDIRTVAATTLQKIGIEDATVKIAQQRPLDFVIRARIKAAARRARGVEK